MKPIKVTKRTLRRLATADEERIEAWGEAKEAELDDLSIYIRRAADKMDHPGVSRAIRREARLTYEGLSELKDRQARRFNKALDRRLRANRNLWRNL